MLFENKNRASDITFIGSGISSSFTILHFLERLKNKPLPKKLNITVVDKQNEFFTGIRLVVRRVQIGRRLFIPRVGFET